jgi:hypothetical protein
MLKPCHRRQGNAQYAIDWTTTRPLCRVKEAAHHDKIVPAFATA